jgi:hypothetical protein
MDDQIREGFLNYMFGDSPVETKDYLSINEKLDKIIALLENGRQN